MQEYEDEVRLLIKRDKGLLNSINADYLLKDVASIQKKITKYLIENKVWIKTCKKCDTVNFITGPYKPDEKIFNRQCEECAYPIFKSVKTSDNRTPTQRKCIYCSTPIFPPNTMTCYEHKNVEFDLYG